MLQRYVEISAYPVIGGHLAQQLVCNVFRICVEDPYLPQPFDAAHLMQQRSQSLSVLQVLAVRRGVLGDQYYLPDSVGYQLARLPQDALRAAAAVCPPYSRYGAVGAVVVAAFRYLEERVVLRRGYQALALHLQIQRSPAEVMLLSSEGPVHYADDVPVLSKPHDGVDLGDKFHHLFPVALRQTTGDDNCLYDPVVLGVDHVVYVVESLHLGALDKAAGVDYGGICLFQFRGDPVSRFLQQITHLLGVYPVLVTAERYEIQVLIPLCTQCLPPQIPSERR